jgi:glutamyl-tRNA reductase
MLSNYKILTVTHQQLNVEDLSSFMVCNQDGRSDTDALEQIKSTLDIDELLYLSTCNRVSYIFFTRKTMDSTYLGKFFTQVNPKMPQNVRNTLPRYVKSYEGHQAVQHLYEVASSMDSLVIGEREIFSQFRKAYNTALENGFIKDNLRLLERFATTTAKSVYANTAIGEKPVSIVSLAMQRFLKNPKRKDSRILIIGAGETNTLAGKFLKKYNFSNVTIFNRSLNNAVELSELLNAKSLHISELEKYKAGFDVIFICTSANKTLIDPSLYQQLLQREDDQKVVIDLAVPRNVDKDVPKLFNVDYVDIEQLRELAEENMNFRKGELVKARTIVEKNVLEFESHYQNRQIEKMLSHIPKEIQQYKDKAINEVYKKQIDALDAPTQELIINMMDYMAKKSISVPMRMAKSPVV